MDLFKLRMKYLGRCIRQYTDPKSTLLKTLTALSVMMVLCACHKHIDVKIPIKPARQLSFEEFTSMLSKEKTYVVSTYYQNDQQLFVPVVNAEDTYTFDGTINDGWITSLQPCIEYHYNFRAFKSDDNIVFEWLDKHLSWMIML